MNSICFFFFFSSRRRHTRLQGDWSSDVCSSDLLVTAIAPGASVAMRLTTLVAAVSSNCTLSPAKNLSDNAPLSQLLVVRSQALGLDGWPPVQARMGAMPETET